MRLVNADDIPYAVNIDHPSGEYDYAYRCEIDALPTVDAVPIEYITRFKEDYCCSDSEKCDINISNVLVELILCWEEEQEKEHEQID